MKAIETKGLTKFYGKARGIIDVNLEVAEGEFFGFIGPNGAGKSTTIRTLLGLINATEGSANVLGLDINGDKTKPLAKVGYLPSEAVFYRGMKVREVLKFSAGLRGLDCRKEAEALCERLELDMSRKVDELSFGNRKKVAIVCAMQHKPDLYILDEPTSGLDPLMQREFFEILKEKNEEGATVFLSSHVLSEIQKNCSRAAIIREGRIVAEGSVEELAASAAKRVVIGGKVDLAGLEGIRDLSATDEGATFLYTGKADKLIKHLAAFDVADLSIAEPDLEEIFMHYYQGGEA
ncbi:MAG: ABC transporter ATP-binding protein [Firmicutes bacterium]|nr:ABC transporter ATP-binding protein [Bacillota bacterium]